LVADPAALINPSNESYPDKRQLERRQPPCDSSGGLQNASCSAAYSQPAAGLHEHKL